MRLFKFFGKVFQEMKKVTWPTFRENRRDTTTVVSVSVFFIVFFSIVDWGVQALLHFI